MILSHLVAALRAFMLSLQYAKALEISRSERMRYIKKSARLALCFAGFGTPWSSTEAWRAGQAAFFCCAYDVVTDWRHFDDEAARLLETILCGFSQLELYPLALTLYEKESKNELADDGLERGAVTLRFIVRMLGCEKEREASWGDLDHLGQLLQIVDDVYDYEDDVSNGEQNCLITENRDEYLRRLLRELSPEITRRCFGSPSVLAFAIAQARKKGTRLLSNTSSE